MSAWASPKARLLKKQVFKDKKLIMKKFVANWEEEQRLQQSFVKII